jgi:hypothetical protein
MFKITLGNYTYIFRSATINNVKVLTLNSDNVTKYTGDYTEVPQDEQTAKNILMNSYWYKIPLTA